MHETVLKVDFVQIYTARVTRVITRDIFCQFLQKFLKNFKKFLKKSRDFSKKSKISKIFHKIWTPLN